MKHVRYGRITPIYTLNQQKRDKSRNTQVYIIIIKFKGHQFSAQVHLAAELLHIP